MKFRSKLWSIVGGIALLGLGVAPTSVGAQVEFQSFSELRGAIADNASSHLQRGFLAKVRVAERKLPPDPCVALRMLNVLDTQVQGLAGKNGFSDSAAQTIRGEIVATVEKYLPPDPCVH